MKMKNLKLLLQSMSKKLPSFLGIQGKKLDIQCFTKSNFIFRDQNNRIYPMYSKQKGVAVIINNQEFSDKDAYPFRTGADVDAKNLEKLFFQLGFQVLVYI